MDDLAPDCSRCKIPPHGSPGNATALKLFNLVNTGFVQANGGLRLVLDLLGIRLDADAGQGLLERLIRIHEVIEEHGREQGQDSP